MKIKRFYIDLTIYILLIAAVILTSCRKNNEYPQYSEPKNTNSIFAMDTYITVTAYGEDTDKALQAAEDKIHSLEKLWSVTDENSEVYAINHSGGQTVQISPETAELLEFSQNMHKRTNGALDISLYPVLTAWGFTTAEYRVPSDNEIANLLENTGVERISLDNQSVHIPTEMQIDL